MIFAANWKMNLSVDDAKNLAQAYKEAGFPAKHEVIVLASDLALHSVAEVFNSDGLIKVYAQDISIFNGYGSFTGEESAHHVADAGGKGCLIGHMERRTHLAENDNEINLKIKNALKSGLNVILSVGETSADLAPDQQRKLIESQLKQDLHEVLAESMQGKLIIAFESVATISSFSDQTGSSLPVADIFNKIAIIKDWMKRNYPGLVVPVIYGGSVAPDNISQFVTADGVGFDGFLIGKKSLDLSEFKKLLEAV